MKLVISTTYLVIQEIMPRARFWTMVSSTVRLATEVLGPCNACIQANQSGYRESNSENISEPAESIGDHFIIDLTFVRLPDGSKLTLLLILEELTNAAFII